jgi:hypothetical protein
VLKTCPKCKNEKPFPEFCPSSLRCYVCESARAKEWRKKQKQAGLCTCGKPSRTGKFYCDECLKGHLADQFVKNRQLKKDAIAAYGGKCRCCGERIEEFLSIDHRKGGGQVHRKEIGSGGYRVYRWLKQHGYPQEDFQVLCFNCNCSRGFFGYCPHEKEHLEERVS